MLNHNDSIEINQDHLWLPYTQMTNHLPQLLVKRAKGSKIFLEDGRVLIDGVASWWSVAHGYQNKYLIQAINKQLNNLSHIAIAGFAVETTYKLASRLCNFAKMDHVFFSDSGSTAIEVAMKMAWQFFINNNQKEKKKFLSFANSYHGDTTGAMSLADLSSGMHRKFDNLLIDNYNLSLPNLNNIADFKNFIAKKHQEIAGIFIEPLVQCAGGMKFHNPQVLEKIASIASENNILLVVDECATGFYRTGKKFAISHTNIKPDIMVLGKALTGGMLTLAATLTTKKVFDSFKSDCLETGLNKALMHGPTFMGNPLACSAANASLDLFENFDYEKKINENEKFLKKSLQNLVDYNNIKEVRVLGLIAVIEFVEISWLEILSMRKKAIELGVFLRPFANCIYLMPPLIIKKSELKKLVDVIYQMLKPYNL